MLSQRSHSSYSARLAEKEQHERMSRGKVGPCPLPLPPSLRGAALDDPCLPACRRLSLTTIPSLVLAPPRRLGARPCPTPTAC